MRKLLSLALVALGLVGAGAATAQTSLHARVSHDEGAMLIRGDNAADWAHATTNGLVLTGDTLWIDEAGVGEVEFPNGTFLRLADRSKVDVNAIDPSIALRAWAGSFYVQRINRSSGNVGIETPAATIGVGPDSSVRIDVNANGLTTVTVRWGDAQVRGKAGGSVDLDRGQICYIESGLLPSEPVGMDAAEEDSFDAWSRERSEYLANGGGNVPKEVTVAPTTLGVSDLNHYGEWVYVDSRPIWRPTVIADYVPYRLGYWSYVPAYGHVWCGTEPFGYVTSHYGRWGYYERYGWCWSYDPVWRPAWVVSVRCGDYYAWTPCDYYNRPVYVTGASYFSIGGVQFSVGATSYVPYNYAYTGPYYVRPWSYDVFRPYYGNNNTIINVNVNVWNIDAGRRRPVVDPFDDDVFTVRDYNPTRSIRGVEKLARDDVRAADRVQRLEQSLGRQDFERVGRSASKADAGPTRPDEVRDVARRNVRVEREGDTTFTRDLARDVRPDATLTPDAVESRAAVRRGRTGDIDSATDRGGADGKIEERGSVRGGDRDARLDMNGVSNTRGGQGATEGRGSVRTAPEGKDDATTSPRRGDTVESGDRGQRGESGDRGQRGESVRTTVPSEGSSPEGVRKGPDAAPRGEGTGRTEVPSDRGRESVTTERPSDSGRGNATRTAVPSDTGRGSVTRTESPGRGEGSVSRGSATRTQVPSESGSGRSSVRSTRPSESSGKTEVRNERRTVAPEVTSERGNSSTRTVAPQSEGRGRSVERAPVRSEPREYQPRSEQPRYEQPRVQRESVRPEVKQERVEAPAPQRSYRQEQVESPRVRVDQPSPQPRSYERPAPSRGNVDAGPSQGRGQGGGRSSGYERKERGR